MSYQKTPDTNRRTTIRCRVGRPTSSVLQIRCGSAPRGPEEKVPVKPLGRFVSGLAGCRSGSRATARRAPWPGDARDDRALPGVVGRRPLMGPRFSKV